VSHTLSREIFSTVWHMAVNCTGFSEPPLTVASADYTYFIVKQCGWWRAYAELHHDRDTLSPRRHDPETGRGRTTMTTCIIENVELPGFVDYLNVPPTLFCPNLYDLNFLSTTVRSWKSDSECQLVLHDKTRTYEVVRRANAVMLTTHALLRVLKMFSVNLKLKHVVDASQMTVRKAV